MRDKVIVPDCNISDYKRIKRTWKARLKYRPFQKYETVYEPVAYIVDNYVLVSFETFSKIQGINPLDSEEDISSIKQAIISLKESV
jgi:hypothetical protein